MDEERLKIYLCALDSKSDFHLLMLGALYRLQQRALSSKPVLSTSHHKNITELIADQWLSQVWAWTAKSKTCIETDACGSPAGEPTLVDLVQGHVNRCVMRKGCIDTGVTFKSQLLCCDGTRTRAELDDAGEWTAKYPDWCSLIRDTFGWPDKGSKIISTIGCSSDLPPAGTAVLIHHDECRRVGFVIGTNSTGHSTRVSLSTSLTA
jgi:hypothetical protein